MKIFQNEVHFLEVQDQQKVPGAYLLILFFESEHRDKKSFQKCHFPLETRGSTGRGWLPRARSLSVASRASFFFSGVILESEKATLAAELNSTRARESLAWSC